MSGLVLPTLISCDESGYTGNNLLNEAQPFFTYASHDLSLEDQPANDGLGLDAHAELASSTDG
jgi:hypothetical protein